MQPSTVVESVRTKKLQIVTTIIPIKILHKQKRPLHNDYIIYPGGGSLVCSVPTLKKREGGRVGGGKGGTEKGREDKRKEDEGTRLKSFAMPL